MKINDFIFYLLLVFVAFFSFDYRLSFFLISCLFFLVLFKSLISNVIFFNIYDLLILIYIGIAYYFYNTGSDNFLIFSRTAVYPWIIFFVFRSVELNKKQLNHLFICAAIILFFISSALIFRDINGNLNLSFDFLFSRTRRDFLYWESNQILGPTNVSTLVGINIIFCLYLLKIFKSRIVYILYFILIMSIFYILILSSRTTWIAIFISFFIYSGYRDGKIYFSRSLVRIIFILFIISIFVFLIPTSSIVGFEDLGKRFEFFTTLRDDNLDARFIRWILAIEMISDNFFGYGFSYYGYKTNLQTPHNEILGQLVSVGVIATSIMIYIYISIFNSIRKLKENKQVQFIFYYMFFSFVIITSITEYYSYAMYNLLHPMIWIVFGLIKNNNIIYKEE